MFESDDEEGEDEEQKIKPKQKMHLKDVIAWNLIEKGPDFDVEEEESRVKTFVEEQEDLQNEVLAAIVSEEIGEDNDEKPFWIETMAIIGLKTGRC